VILVGDSTRDDTLDQGKGNNQRVLQQVTEIEHRN